ncbi:MAG: hypothetical protein GX354_05385 [Firmicutes bacterium]|jgi:hypothetical protein|nr:hypothetical protein [Bacillota bacterium]
MGGLLHNGVKGWLITILAVLCLVVTCGMCGKAKESGGEPLPILRFGTTARIWGMGNAGVAAARGVEGLYYNPAALSDLSRPELSISHSALFSDTDLNFIAAALPITEQGGIGAGLLLLSSPGIPGTSEDALEDYFDYLQAVAYVGTGTRINEQLGAGVTVKGLFGRLDDATCRGYALEGGLRYKLNQVLTLGILGRDVVGRLDWTTGLTENLPTQVLAGVEASLWDGRLQVAAQTDTTFKDRGFGAEYIIGEQIRVRGGYTKESLTAGVGLGVGSIHLDYSWVGHELGGTHRISFMVGF